MGNLMPLRDFDDPSYSPYTNDDIMFGNMTDPYPRLREIASRGSVQIGDTRESLWGLARDARPGKFTSASTERLAGFVDGGRYRD